MANRVADKKRLRCGSSRYKPSVKAGGGSWGVVYLAHDEETGREVAVKTLHNRGGEKHGKLMIQREVGILRACQGSSHVVALLDVFENSSGATFLVMERMRHDLRGLIECRTISGRWSRSQVKGYAAQLLEAVAYCHERGFMHRDLKPANVLVDERNTLKLGDFGLASSIRRRRGDDDSTPDGMEHYARYTNAVCTLWYRAPELLYGSRSYGPSVDVWSAGCIVGELLQNSLLMPGHSEENQLRLIHALCGTPLENGWPEVAELERWPQWRALCDPPVVRDFQRTLITDNKLVARKPFFSAQAVALLDALLALKPESRPSARSALGHAYFDAAQDGGVAVMPACDMIRYNDKSYFATAK